MRTEEDKVWDTFKEMRKILKENTKYTGKPFIRITKETYKALFEEE